MTDVPDQADLLEATDWDWILLLDAGRPDIFAEVYDGDYTVAYNGGALHTPQWFREHFAGEYDLVLFTASPLLRVNYSADYDEYEHFEYVTSRAELDNDAGYHTHPETLNDTVRAYLDGGVSERLADLGYGNAEVNLPKRGIVRYMQPHYPYRDFEWPAQGGGLIPRTKRCLERGDVTHDEWRGQYTQEYALGVRYARELATDLPGNVVLTADHGECLGDCGCYYHGPKCDPHDHLVCVPWVVL